jgi:hypothetical protein
VAKKTIRKKSSTRKKAAQKPRYAKPRVVQSWNTPERAYVSCLATAAYDDGKRGMQIVYAVEDIAPWWHSAFDTEPSDTALISRAHNSRRGPTSKTEAPEVSVHKKPVWRMAKRDYKAGVCSLRSERRAA